MGAEVAVDLQNLVTGWPLLKVVLCYAVCPYVVLWLAVRCFPKDDDRRAEYLGEYEHVPPWQRPLWVGERLPRCLLNGLPDRFRAWRSARAPEPLSPLEDARLLRLEFLASGDRRLLEQALSVLPAALGDRSSSERVLRASLLLDVQRHVPGLYDRFVIGGCLDLLDEAERELVDAEAGASPEVTAHIWSTRGSIARQTYRDGIMGGTRRSHQWMAECYAMARESAPPGDIRITATHNAGLVMIDEGLVSPGLVLLEDARRQCLESGSHYLDHAELNLARSLIAARWGVEGRDRLDDLHLSRTLLRELLRRMPKGWVLAGDAQDQYRLVLRQIELWTDRSAPLEQWRVRLARARLRHTHLGSRLARRRRSRSRRRARRPRWI